MRISDWSSDGCSSDLVWAEVPYLFDPQYRAALAWAEEVTRVSETHASDEAYAAAAAAFEPRDLVDLTIAIAAMNAFNRLGAPFRLPVRSEEHTSELQSLMRISYAVFCLKKTMKHYY